MGSGPSNKSKAQLELEAAQKQAAEQRDNSAVRTDEVQAVVDSRVGDAERHLELTTENAEQELNNPPIAQTPIPGAPPPPPAPAEVVEESGKVTVVRKPGLSAINQASREDSRRASEQQEEVVKAVADGARKALSDKSKNKVR